MAIVIEMPGLAGPMPFVGNGRIRSVDEMYATKKSLDVQMSKPEWKAKELIKRLERNIRPKSPNSPKKSNVSENCGSDLGKMQNKLQELDPNACFQTTMDNKSNQALVNVLKNKDLLLQFMKNKKLQFDELDIKFLPSYKKNEKDGRFKLLKESKSFQEKRKQLIKSVLKKARIGQPPFQKVVQIAPASASDSLSNNDTPGVKGRLPGYADRVLVRNLSKKLSNYRVLKVMGSDHSPVSVQVENPFSDSGVNQKIIEIITFNTGGNVKAVDEILNYVRTKSAENIRTILCLQEINDALHKRVISSKILFGEISSNPSKIPHNFRLGVYCTTEDAITEPQTKRFDMFSKYSIRAHTKGFMYVTCKLYGGAIKVLTLHAPFKNEEQSHESWNELFNFVAAKVADKAEKEKWNHVVMCGDFNSRSVFGDSLEKDVTHCLQGGQK